MIANRRRLGKTSLSCKRDCALGQGHQGEQDRRGGLIEFDFRYEGLGFAALAFGSTLGIGRGKPQC
jgi:hypothetical protein